MRVPPSVQLPLLSVDRSKLQRSPTRNTRRAIMGSKSFSDAPRAHGGAHRPLSPSAQAARSAILAANMAIKAAQEVRLAKQTVAVVVVHAHISSKLRPSLLESYRVIHVLPLLTRITAGWPACAVLNGRGLPTSHAGLLCRASLRAHPLLFYFRRNTGRRPDQPGATWMLTR